MFVQSERVESAAKNTSRNSTQG